MCVVKSCNEHAGESPVCGNTTGSAWSQNRVLGVASREVALSVDRSCAGRNAFSSVKVSSPDNILRGGRPTMEQGMQHRRLTHDGTTGVQVHGMYRRLVTKHKSSASSRRNACTPRARVASQDQKIKQVTILAAEVRCLHSSEDAA
jgi:hypothetical protein